MWLQPDLWFTSASRLKTRSMRVLGFYDPIRFSIVEVSTGVNGASQGPPGVCL